jgi:hypothetical protein
LHLVDSVCGVLLCERSLKFLLVPRAEEHAIGRDIKELACYLAIFVHDFHGSKL